MVSSSLEARSASSDDDISSVLRVSTVEERSSFSAVSCETCCSRRSSSSYASIHNEPNNHASKISHVLHPASVWSRASYASLSAWPVNSDIELPVAPSPRSSVPAPFVISEQDPTLPYLPPLPSHYHAVSHFHSVQRATRLPGSFRCPVRLGRQTMETEGRLWVI